ncbi:MAG TPA: nuclear transport factor 2 family protein [Bacteroidales bacterium]|nr:nuclear transport factor 2 family protein [Bacteroidales bacterium]HPT21867.1 nuclear transport factor 2 family protein [Bacteroidales bacterium]
MKTKLLLPFFVLLIGCTAGNWPLTESQKEAVVKDAAPVVKAFYESMTVNDTAKLMSFMDFGPEMTVINIAGLFNSKEMRKTAGKFFAVVEKQTFETKSEKYTVVDPDCFIYTWYGKNGVYIKGGEPIIYDDLLGSYTFRKIKGEWKIIHLHESTKIPEVSDPVKMFTEIEQDWGTAVMDKDAAALDQLYATEYKFIDAGGHAYNKQQDISEITGPTYKLLAPWVLGDINVSSYGVVAMVTGTNTVKESLNGKEGSRTVSFTDFFVYRDGRWQCFFSQSRLKPAK